MGLERRLIGKEHMLVLSTQLNTLLYLKKNSVFYIYIFRGCVPQLTQGNRRKPLAPSYLPSTCTFSAWNLSLQAV